MGTVITIRNLTMTNWMTPWTSRLRKRPSSLMVPCMHVPMIQEPLRYRSSDSHRSTSDAGPPAKASMSARKEYRAKAS